MGDHQMEDASFWLPADFLNHQDLQFQFQFQYQFHRLQAAKLRQQQMMKQQHQQFLQQRRRVVVARNSAWQQSQPPVGSGMRAVFLAKRESSGTGVFLPRPPTETETKTKTETPRKKRGCSTTVLIPDRVVQAFNFNLLQSQPLQPHHHYDAEMGYRKSVFMDKDLRLPQEWTY